MALVNRRKEHDALVDAILVELGKHPELGNFWPQPTGFVLSEKGYAIHYGLEGSADISGILCSGLRCEIEVKTGEATQQKNQKDFQAMIEKNKGVYLVARDITSVLSRLEALCKS